MTENKKKEEKDAREISIARKFAREFIEAGDNAAPAVVLFAGTKRST